MRFLDTPEHPPMLSKWAWAQLDIYLSPTAKRAIYIAFTGEQEGKMVQMRDNLYFAEEYVKWYKEGLKRGY